MSVHGPIFESAPSPDLTPRRARRPAKSDEVAPRYVTLERAADYIDATPRTIRRAIAEGRLTGYRFGKRMLRVDLNEVEAALRPVPAVAS
ncbi:MAG TPA: excisionase family DNA-binding protein [Acidothermaceae bacterium]